MLAFGRSSSRPVGVGVLNSHRDKPSSETSTACTISESNSSPGSLWVIAVFVSERLNVCELIRATSSAFENVYSLLDVPGLAAAAEERYLVADNGVKRDGRVLPRRTIWTSRPRGRTRSITMLTADSAGAVTRTKSNPELPATSFALSTLTKSTPAWTTGSWISAVSGGERSTFGFTIVPRIGRSWTSPCRAFPRR